MWFVYRTAFENFEVAKATNITSRTVAFVRPYGGNGRVDRDKVVLMTDTEKLAHDARSQLMQSRAQMHAAKKLADDQHELRIQRILTGFADAVS